MSPNPYEMHVENSFKSVNNVLGFTRPVEANKAFICNESYQKRACL